MFNFIFLQYRMGKINAETLARCVEKGFITQEEADEIMNS